MVSVKAQSLVVECFYRWSSQERSSQGKREGCALAEGSCLFQPITISKVLDLDHASHCELPGNNLFIYLSISEHGGFALPPTSTSSLGDTLSLMIRPIFHGLCLLASEPPSDSSNQSKRVMRFVLKAPAETGVQW